MKITDDALVAMAIEARKKSYCPYSGFAVGAALLSADGKVYTGANIENAAFSPSICAERVALFSAVHDGQQNFVAIAVAGGKQGEGPQESFPPCGVCRQALAEFCAPDLRILMAGKNGFRTAALSELLPFAFGPGNLDDSSSQ